MGHFRAPRARETHLQSSELPSGPFGVALCSHGFDQPWLLIGALIPVSGPCVPLGFSLMAKGPWSFPGQACLNAFPRRLCPLLPVAKEWAAPGQASFLMLSAVDGGAGSCGLPSTLQSCGQSLLRIGETVGPTNVALESLTAWI